MPTSDIVGRVQSLQLFLKRHVGLDVLILSGEVLAASNEILALGGRARAADAFPDPVLKGGIRHGSPRDPENVIFRRENLLHEERKQGGKELAMGQVAGGAEDHDAARGWDRLQEAGFFLRNDA